jgi:hypothetical protein
MRDGLLCGQMRLTPKDLAQRQPLVRVQVCVRVRVGDAASAGVIVMARWEFEVTLARGRD